MIDGECRNFKERAKVFLEHLATNSFPNAPLLARLCKCSRNTAQRTIYRLRDVYGLPLIYDERKKGYYLSSAEQNSNSTIHLKDKGILALLTAREMLLRHEFSSLADELLSVLLKGYGTEAYLAAKQIKPDEVLRTLNEAKLLQGENLFGLCSCNRKDGLAKENAPPSVQAIQDQGDGSFGSPVKE